jgi:hypothetical protein
VTLPQTWTALWTFLAIPDDLGRTVWAALSRAHGSAAVALRQAFLLHEPIPGQGVADRSSCCPTRSGD